MHIDPEVQAALQAGQAVVALESAVITHGLPQPHNLNLARTLDQIVREEGAVPATIALWRGEVLVGVREDLLKALAQEPQVDKASLWNLASLMAKGQSAGTTVAVTALLAHQAGIKVFATGGIGGVHREPPYDESADLIQLSRTPIVVVSSGAKSILNLPATLERLESYGVTVLGYRTERLPAFYTPSSPYPLPSRVEHPEEVARIYRASQGLLASATLVFQGVSQGLAAEEVEAWIERAQQEALERGIRGKALTPYLLGRLAELSQGATIEVNLRLLAENARLAAQIARALSGF
jgi:pseudouridine-5'-phosphate glycosidase